MLQLNIQLQERFQAEHVKIWSVASKAHFVLRSLMLSEHMHPYLICRFKGNYDALDSDSLEELLEWNKACSCSC